MSHINMNNEQKVTENGALTRRAVPNVMFGSFAVVFLPRAEMIRTPLQFHNEMEWIS